MDDGNSDAAWSWTKILLGIFLVFVILVSIFGNLLVCLAVGYDRKLRRLGNFFIVSLAIADLCVGALVMTFALANDLLEYWPFGPELCEIWIAFDISCSTCSIINLCAIALDRFAHIKDPMLYNRWMNRRIMGGAVTLIWAISGAISFIPIALGWHKPSVDGSDNTLALPAINTVMLQTATVQLEQQQQQQQQQEAQNLLLNGSTMDGHRILHHAHKLNQSLSIIQHQYQQQQHHQQQQQQQGYQHHTLDPLMFNSDSSGMGVAGGSFGTLPQCALDLTPTYAVVSSIISFYAPCLVMVYLYVKLYKICQKHVKCIKSMAKYQPVVVVDPSSTKLPTSVSGTISLTSSRKETQLQTLQPKLSQQLSQQNNHSSHQSLSMVSRTHSENDVGGAARNNNNHHHHHHSQHSQYQQQQQQQHHSTGTNEHKAAITLGIIMGTFLACWMPFFCMNILAAYCKSCISPMVFKVLTWLGYFNSSLNPAIYSIFNTEFRDAFRRILVRGFMANDPDACVGRILPCCREKRSSGSAPASSSGNNQFANSRVPASGLCQQYGSAVSNRHSQNGHSLSHQASTPTTVFASQLPATPIQMSAECRTPNERLFSSIKLDKHNDQNFDDDKCTNSNNTTNNNNNTNKTNNNKCNNDNSNIVPGAHTPAIGHRNTKTNGTMSIAKQHQHKNDDSAMSDGHESSDCQPDNGHTDHSNKSSFNNNNTTTNGNGNRNTDSKSGKTLISSDKYQRTPKFQHINVGATLQQYQSFDYSEHSYSISKTEFCKYSSLENVVSNLNDN